MSTNDTQQEAQHEGGLGLPLFIQGLQTVLSKSSDKRLKQFLEEYDDRVDHKWILVSDYTVHDENKEADVLVFTLLPHMVNINNFIAIITRLAPQDLKCTEKVNPNFATFLHKIPSIHFAVILPKDWTRIGGNTATHAIVEQFVNNYGNLLKHWEGTTPKEAKRFAAIRKEMEKTSRNLKRRDAAWNSDQGKHVKKIQDVIFIASITYAILEKIMHCIPSSQICWMPDRDGTMEWPKSSLPKGEIFNEIVLDFLWISSSTCENAHDVSKLAIAVPEAKGSVWYDEFIRIPDHIAGAISRINMDTGCTNERLSGLVTKAIADNDNLIVVRIDEKSACRVRYSNNKP